MVRTMSATAPTAAAARGYIDIGMDIAQPLDGSRISVEGAHAVSGLGEMTRHRMSHDAETDETDSRAFLRGLPSIDPLSVEQAM